jgi:hypothetical protein
MKKLSLSLALVFSGSVMGQNSLNIPHLDLDMTSEEYRIHLKKTEKFKGTLQDDPTISSTIALGERLSAWIRKINEGRNTESAIRLTSPTDRISTPIEKPKSYSPNLIKQRVDQVLADMPAAMKDVLTSGADLPTNAPVDDETFIKFGRLLDRQYQSAARYKSLNPYRSEYIRNAKNDVRGFYYLKKNNITDKELGDISQIPVEQLPQIKEALSQICFNSFFTSQDKCKQEVDVFEKNNILSKLYLKYIGKAKETWDNFFQIPSHARRRDIVWSGKTATVPFNTPTISKFIPYLQNNIEDEFRWNDWGLKINFGSFYFGPTLVFQPGVVPHVNALGGNQIVMDSNQPIEEYESQWTIRHEFGHVLGLPDCYHEFYDVAQDAFVQYQIDTTDLMCSRAGNMNERIYLELKQAYQK